MSKLMVTINTDADRVYFETNVDSTPKDARDNLQLAQEILTELQANTEREIIPGLVVFGQTSRCPACVVVRRPSYDEGHRVGEHLNIIVQERIESISIRNEEG